jgi:phospholipase C
VNKSTSNPYTVEVNDNAYQKIHQTKVIKPSASAVIVLDCSKSFGWYDVSIKVKDGQLFEKRYAGRVEMGKAGFTDPFMGRAVKEI